MNAPSDLRKTSLSSPLFFMIIALNNYLQKHHKVLLGLLLALMIGSFVFAGFVNDRSAGASLKLAHRGINLTDTRSTRQARDLAALRTGLSPDQFITEAQQAALKQKEGMSSDSQNFAVYVSMVDSLAEADALGIPAPDEKTLKEFVLTFAPFLDRSTGKFSPANFKNFSDFALGRLGIDETRLAGALGNFWRLEKLNAIKAPAKAPALDVLAGRLVSKNLTSWTVETASFSRSGFNPVVPQDEAAIAAYFEANKSRYLVAEKLRLRVAKIDGDSAAATKLPEPSDDELRDVASKNQNNPNLVKFTGNAANASEVGAYLKANHSPLLALWREGKAGEIAATAIADKIIATLPSDAARPDDAKLDAALKSIGFSTITKLPAYGRDSLPKDTGVPDAILLKGLELGAARWRTSAIPYGRSVYLIAFDGAEPARPSTLAEARTRVVADRNGEESTRLFAEAAAAKATSIAEAVKAGKNFADSAKAAGLTASPAVNFEFRSPPANLSNLMAGLDTLPVGGVSGALRDDEDRVVVHIISRLAPDSVKNTALIETSRDNIGRASADATAYNPSQE